MLQYISEGPVLPLQTPIVLHYLVRLREEALFLDILQRIKENLGERFQGHLWVTRGQMDVESPARSTQPLQVHTHIVSHASEVGQSWEWWNTFSNYSLEHFDTEEKRDKSLVYICGPQGLTDRLIEMYKDMGLHTEDGHVQIEKWW